jgi:NADH-quinone oxidoreductase subunit D
MEEISGGRMHYMFNQVGGLKQDLPEDWLGHVVEAIVAVRDEVGREVEPLLLGDVAFRAATRGVGILTADVVAAYGVSGPPARASAVDLDLRRDDPYLAYDELPADVLRIVTRTEGDCLARFECLLEQIHVSLDIVAYCASQLEQIEPGPINVKLPKVLKAPEGATYAWTENPLGVNGYYIVSRGERTPWRLKLRTASFNNVQALREILPGQRIEDLVMVLGSLFFVVGDIDK